MAALAEDFDFEGQCRLMGYLQENCPDDMQEGLKQLSPTKLQKIMRGDTTETDSSDGVILPP